MIRSGRGALVSVALFATGCQGVQSALDPAGPSAASIHLLGIVMYVGAGLVTGIVVVLMLVPFLSQRHRAKSHRVFLWTGAGLPAVTLTVLVPWVLIVGQETRAPDRPEQLTIEVTGHLYWWSMSYHRGSAL